MARLVVRRPDRGDRSLPGASGRGGAFLEGAPDSPGRADVSRRRPSLRVLRLRHALLRQCRDAPGRGRSGSPPEGRRVAGGMPPETPLGTRKALLRPGSPSRRQRVGSAGRRRHPHFSANRAPAPPGRLCADRRGLCRRSRRVAAAFLRSRLRCGVRQKVHSGSCESPFEDSESAPMTDQLARRSSLITPRPLP